MTGRTIARIVLSSLLALLVLSFPTASAVRPALAASIIDDWSSLVTAFKSLKTASGNVTTTMTLASSFTMAGYVGSPIFVTGSDHVIIEGQGAVFDGAGHGSFFFLVGAPSLTVTNVTMKNAFAHADGGGAVFVNRGGRLVLDGCTMVNNTCAIDGGGALYFMPDATGLIKGCSFVHPVSQFQNDIFHYGKVTFACADGEVGKPVQAPGWPHNMSVIPPEQLKCK